MTILETYSKYLSFLLFFWPYHTVNKISVPQPRMETALPALEGQSLNHWTTMEVYIFLKKKKKQEHFLGNSLIVQWLGLCTFTRRDPGSILGWGTKILQAMPSDKKKKKSPQSTNMFLNSKMLKTFPLKSKTRKGYLISRLLFLLYWLCQSLWLCGSQ